MEKMGREDSGSSTASETATTADESAVLSDESSFYGDEEMKSGYEVRSSEFDPAPFWRGQHRSLQWIAEQNREAAEAKSARVKHHHDRLKAAQKKMEHEDSVETGSPQLIDVLLSGKQPMDIDPPISRQEPSPSPPTEFHNPYEGDPMAKQLHETLFSFLSRLPPSTTPLSIGPWIRIANPHRHTNRQAQDKPDIAGLKQEGHRLLETFSTQRRQLEARHPEKPAGTITRMMKAARDLLEEDIVKLARAKNVKEGKWMLFPSPQNVDEVWAKVAKATWEGELGVGAKVATKNDDDEKSERSRLVCVYTRDFEDRVDVARVLKKLVAMKLVGSEQGIFYKCDAYTYLDVMGGNEWKLRASMYGSREMLKEG